MGYWSMLTLADGVVVLGREYPDAASPVGSHWETMILYPAHQEALLQDLKEGIVPGWFRLLPMSDVDRGDVAQLLARVSPTTKSLDRR